MKPAALAFLLCLSSAVALAETPHPSFTVRTVGKGRPILLIPGLACGGDVWDETARHLSAHAEVHVITLAGFAGQPRVPAPMLATARAEIARWARERHLVRPVVVGHSLGGFLAFWLAASEPGLFGGLVAVEGAPFLAGFTDPAATAESVRPRAEQLRAMVAKTFTQGNRATLGAMIKSPRDADRIAATSGKSDPTAVADAFYELMTTDLRPLLGKIKVPTLVLVSGQTPEALFSAQLGAVSTRKVESIPDTLHFVMLDAPAAFQARLDRFLAEAGK